MSLSAQRGVDYLDLGEGAWCWFSDPRAVYDSVTGRIVFARTASNGDLVVATYDPATAVLDSTVVMPHFQKDDHTVPSILFLPDGRLMLFFTRHNGGFYYTRSLRPHDISAFEEVRMRDLGNMMCYTNPVLLREEHDRIYVFFRGGTDSKPSFIWSDDLGESWSSPRTLVSRPGAAVTNRPYTKVYSDDRSTIWFAFTDGHPRKEPCNSIYFLAYRKGKFYDAAGNVLGDTSALPLDQNMIPRVYDGEKTRVRAWIWDLAADREGHPVLTYATFPEDALHVYHYARWNGTSWENHRICRGGKWFPRYPGKKEDKEPEPHYSGGVVLDPQDPSVVYLSRPHDDIFEIECWTTPDQGTSWHHTAVTRHSEHDNVRPFVVRDHPAGLHPQVLWMNMSVYRHYTDFRSTIRGDLAAPLFSGVMVKDSVKRVMRAVADWEIGHFDPPSHHPLDWTNGALYAGIFAWSQISDEPEYLGFLERIGRRYGWQPGFRMYHADDLVVPQTFLDIYRLKKDERMLAPSRARACWIVEHPSRASLDFRNFTPYTTDRWSWCDALFMAPPFFARLYVLTGDKKFYRFMDKEFHSTYDYLYDPEDHLFYRDSRYFDKREANGKKVFWGRGNGWVMGGLVRILQQLPENQKGRDFYEQLFREMAARVALLQDSAGYWHASLLDPASYPAPETSATGFFVYALAWGVREGLLDEATYMPVVRKGWAALVRAVHADGKLGWVQPIGADPRKVTREMTEVYGAGAFLLAGSQVYRLAK